jgi:hypothetical protein
MKIAIGLLCLFSFLPQTNSDSVIKLPKDPVVAVILRHEPVDQADPWATDVVLMKESQARAKYARLAKLKARMPKQDALLAALTIALETIPEPQFLPRSTDTRAFLDNEIRRGVRKPLQGEN